ncbi:thioredoxin domain-containing protein [Tunturiibacter lichenicola]|uniref:thioredoxin domain-containing protein n=1 Tax=Tunturiibacter lichenicola TaxID=2051959 RepID=UPI003D9BC10D
MTRTNHSAARLCIFLALIVSAIAPSPARAQQPTLHWQPWSDAAFTTARQQHKFVLLDLEAVWCHWCHVMDDVTYRDPTVIRLLNEKYILVKVDQDSRPDISNRYQDYGWPATVVFAPDGSEIVKRQGFLQPRLMASMLKAIIDDPSPGPSIEREAALHPAADATIAPALLNRIHTSYDAQYDQPNSGWGFVHKYLDEESVEYALRLSARNNALYTKRTTDTLHNATYLIDPVWGGAYQYSVSGDWREPHFEKLISIQASYLREYSLAYAQTHNPEDLAAAQSVHRYVHTFLTDAPTGVFFVSQDADLHDGEDNEPYFKLDDRGRRAQGIPRIDKHVYARENGWTIAALCHLYAVSGDTSALTEAKHAANWIAIHRTIPGGGFRHDDVDPAGPYLGDTLAMGHAYLALYNVTGDRNDLSAATSAAKFIAAHFAPTKPGTGFITSPTRTDAAYRPHPDRDENVALVRFTSLLSQATGDPTYHQMAAEAMRYLASSTIALQPLSAGTLLAYEDFTQDPLHITILGPASDQQAAALHTAALRSLTSHELIEWRDPTDHNPLPTAVTYPPLKQSALFLCTARACSSPIYRPEDVAAKIHKAQLSN